MGLIYGNILLEQQKQSTVPDFVSIAYQEYCNYSGLLESCVSEEDKSLLEAKVEVLREVAIKDIFARIKEVWRLFKEWVNKMITKFKEKIQELTTKKQVKNNSSDKKESENKSDNSDIEDIKDKEEEKQEEEKVSNITVKYYDAGSLSSLVLLKSLNMKRFSVYDLAEEAESGRELLNDLIDVMKDVDKEKVRHNTGADKKISFDDFVETAENNLKEFLDFSVEEYVTSQEVTIPSNTIDRLKSNISRATNNLSDANRSCIRCINDVKSSIGFYETRIKNMENKISLADLDEDKNVDINQLNKTISVINHDINRFKKVLEKYMQDAVKIAKYLAFNNNVLENL